MAFQLQRTSCNAEHKGICCGISYKYFDLCGHAMTHTDHHDSCPESIDRWPVIQTYAPLTAHQWTLRSNRLPPPLPLQFSTCKNPHRFVQIVHDKCTCHYGRDQNYHETHGYPTRSDLGDGIIPPDVMLERRVFWLREQERARVIENGYDMRDHESIMILASIHNSHERDPLKHAYSYDHLGQTGTFLKTAEGSDLSPSNLFNPSCAICEKDYVGKTDLRILPCKCILCMGCVRKWFSSRKNCPVCDQRFRLVKVPEDWETYCPAWNDDLDIALPGLVGKNNVQRPRPFSGFSRMFRGSEESIPFSEIGEFGNRTTTVGWPPALRPMPARLQAQPQLSSAPQGQVLQVDNSIRNSRRGAISNTSGSIPITYQQVLGSIQQPGPRSPTTSDQGSSSPPRTPPYIHADTYYQLTNTLPPPPLQPSPASFEQGNSSSTRKTPFINADAYYALTNTLAPTAGPSPRVHLAINTQPHTLETIEEASLIPHNTPLLQPKPDMDSGRSLTSRAPPPPPTSNIKVNANGQPILVLRPTVTQTTGTGTHPQGRVSLSAVGQAPVSARRGAFSFPSPTQNHEEKKIDSSSDVLGKGG